MLSQFASQMTYWSIPSRAHLTGAVLLTNVTHGASFWRCDRVKELHLSAQCNASPCFVCLFFPIWPWSIIFVVLQIKLNINSFCFPIFKQVQTIDEAMSVLWFCALAAFNIVLCRGKLAQYLYNCVLLWESSVVLTN